MSASEPFVRHSEWLFIADCVNRERCPAEFTFRLSADEIAVLSSQFCNLRTWAGLSWEGVRQGP